MTPTIDLPANPLSGVTIQATMLGSGDESILSDDELRRASRFHRPSDRTLWIAGRCWLRTTLGARLDVDPSRIRFRYGPMGKPSLAWPETSTTFSFSHSGSAAVLASGEFHTLGVDVERIRTGVYDRPAAAIVLSPREISWVEAAPDRDRRFLRCWVRKEAFGKALGSGIDRSLAALDLTPEPGGSIKGLSVRNLEGIELVAAVAVPSSLSSPVEEHT